MEWHITGASGFIGSHMVNYLVRSGEKVVAYYRTPPTDQIRIKNLAHAYEHRQVDLLTQLPNFSTADRVMHFAADMGGVGYFHAHDLWPYIANSTMTFAVLESISRYETPRSFLASSACAYPTQFQQSLRHTLPLSEWMLDHGSPDQMYGREKLAMIRLGERMPQDVRVGILHTIYGVGQESDGERVKFPVAAAKKALDARRTGVINCWGNGEQRRSYLYIDDAVAKIMAIMESDVYEGPVNVGKAGAISCNDVLDLCAQIVDVKAAFTYSDDKPSGVANRDCDNTKFNDLYGDLDIVQYEEGFSRLIQALL